MTYTHGHLYWIASLVNNHISFLIYRKYGLKSGLHGTSLWNQKYKDVDLLVFSLSGDINSFKKAFNELLEKHYGKILGQRGKEISGLDYDVKIGNMVLHLSYVILL